MDIESLRYFQYIAKYKNITKAAQHFYINQSTLSRQIMGLEEELGVKLFVRDNRRLELTEAGNVFNKECELFIRHMELVIQKTQLAGKGDSGTLRIVTPGNLDHILPQSISSFRNSFPETYLHIEAYNLTEITSAILYDLYDVGFTYEFAALDHDEIEKVPVGEDDFSIVISSRFNKGDSKKDIAEIVRSLPLILPSHLEPPFIKLIMYELQTLGGMKSSNVQYLNSDDSVMLQISLGMGYSIVPTSLIKAMFNDEQLTFLPLHHFSTKSKIIMLYKKTNPSKLVSRFVDIVVNQCGNKSPNGTKNIY